MSAQSLRQRVLRGGAYLAARQGAGTLINIAGVLLLTRVIGPAQFGLYAAAVGVFAAVQLAAQFGMNVYLVRHPEEPAPALYDQSALMLLVSGILFAAAGIALAPVVEHTTRLDGVGIFAAAAFAALPVVNLTLVPMARLERALEYRSVTWVELTAQLAFFVVGVPLAFAGWGAWAPLLGWWAQHLVNFALYHRIARYRPHWHFDRAVARDILRYGVSYSASLWLWHLRRLVNPFVVGRFLGAEAVAFVAVATQIVTNLSFVANATWRLATSALARIQHDAQRMAGAIGEGMPLQVVAVAPFLVAFGFVAPWIVPALLGEEWSTIVAIYPFIAAAWVTIAAFNLHCSALYVLAQNARISVYHAAHSVLLLGASLVLVPRYGLIGYGYAELVNLASFGVLHVITTRVVGSLSYERMAPLWFASMLLLFHTQLGWLSIAGAIVAILWARPWYAVQGLLAGLRGSYAYE